MFLPFGQKAASRDIEFFGNCDIRVEIIESIGSCAARFTRSMQGTVSW